MKHMPGLHCLEASAGIVSDTESTVKLLKREFQGFEVSSACGNLQVLLLILLAEFLEGLGVVHVVWGGWTSFTKDVQDPIAIHPYNFEYHFCQWFLVGPNDGALTSLDQNPAGTRR